MKRLTLASRGPIDLPGGGGPLEDPGTDRCDLAWLDEPILARRGRRFNKAIEWFIDQVPVRAQRVILKGALGEMWRVEPVLTLREFIALPTRTMLKQGSYGYKTHTDLCHTLRAYGVTGQLFSGDEEDLPHVY